AAPRRLRLRLDAPADADARAGERARGHLPIPRAQPLGALGVAPRLPLKRAAALILAPLLASGVVACGSTVSTSSFKGASQAVAQRIADFQSDVDRKST